MPAGACRSLAEVFSAPLPLRTRRQRHHCDKGFEKKREVSMLTTVRCSMPGHQDQQPGLLKAFDADFKRIFFDQAIDQPDQLKPISTLQLRSSANCDGKGPQGHASIEAASVACKVTGFALSTKNGSSSPPKLERYLLDEAEYIRTFGLT
jgi:hypothetical protein